MNVLTPCKDCPERFPACSASCPKDARGEVGYKAWLAEYRRKEDEKKELSRYDYRPKRYKAMRYSQNEKWY